MFNGRVIQPLDEFISVKLPPWIKNPPRPKVFLFDPSRALQRILRRPRVSAQRPRGFL